MKKNKRLKEIITLIVLLINFICSSFLYRVYAENEIELSTEDILKSQSSSMGLSSFIEEANKYKNEDFDIDVKETISSAIKGNINNKTLVEKVLSVFFGQIGKAITTIRQCDGNYYNFQCVKKCK